MILLTSSSTSHPIYYLQIILVSNAPQSELLRFNEEEYIYICVCVYVSLPLPPVAYPGIFFGEGVSPGIFFRRGDSTNNQLRTEGRENGDMGAVAP
jgi:hypothetical protein